MIDQITDAKSIKELQESLEYRRKLLSTPILSDLRLIETIYDIFNAIESTKSIPPRKGSVNQRKKFCFIALRLYSPATILFGDQMIKGLRKKIAEILGVRAFSSISDYCEDVIFLYKTYKSFRPNMDYLYKEMLSQLISKKILNKDVLEYL
ncbi:hypothetical protein [Bacteroides fragilis]|uniref:hypothetical protein n=1 Tax=Bacteroides fragilis TaxID=817 RepID=UPI0020305D2F|nr:hypothetical protein [Bacteroides fragilis]MCM0314272.1 hypothetical protein [Bacteroides fragilis]